MPSAGNPRKSPILSVCSQAFAKMRVKKLLFDFQPSGKYYAARSLFGTDADIALEGLTCHEHVLLVM